MIMEVRFLSFRTPDKVLVMNVLSFKETINRFYTKTILSKASEYDIPFTYYLTIFSLIVGKFLFYQNL